jgi:hypothetical protein
MEQPAESIEFQNVSVITSGYSREAIEQPSVPDQAKTRNGLWSRGIQVC